MTTKDLAKMLGAKEHALFRIKSEVVLHRRSELTAVDVARICSEYLKRERERIRTHFLGRK